MSEYGMIYDTSSIKNQLKEANRDYTGRKTWENLYSSIDLSEKQQINALKQDYAKAMSAAYSTAYQNKAAIANSNLGQGYKVSAIDDVDAALQKAYAKYQQDYLKDTSKIESTANEAYENVNSALTEQAEYTKKFANAPYQYLQYLFDKYNEGSDKDNIFLTNDLWKRYTYEETDDEGNLTGERALKSWEDIKNYGAYEEYIDNDGAKQKEWTGLFDDSGNLTIKGADFYDQMMNDLAQKGGYSFGEWLSTEDEDLYNWSKSYNPYDYTTDQSNAGSFRTMVGLTSTDQTYSFIERYGGMSKKELDSKYSKFTNKVNELNDKIKNNKNGKTILEEYKALTSDIETLTDKLGITDDIESQMNMTFDQLASTLYNLTENAYSSSDIWWQSLGSAFGTGFLTSSAEAAALKAGASAAVASAFPLARASASVPVVGWIVAALIATGAAVYSGISTANNLKAQNKQLATQGQTAYNNLVKNLVDYSQQQRRQKQIEWNKANS